MNFFPRIGQGVPARADFHRLPVGTEVRMWSGEVKTVHPDTAVKYDDFPALVWALPPIPDWLEAAARAFAGRDWVFINGERRRELVESVRSAIQVADQARGISA